MLKILFTYDYELFLGKNYSSAEEILFEPTRKISKAMLDQGAHGVFFADVCSAIRHREVGLNDYSDAFDQQIQDLTKDHHDVQLHLHTNWYYSERLGDSLEVSPKGYRVQEFGFDPKDARSAPSIVAETKKYLEERCSSVMSEYRCMAYRAGGFGVQPEKELFKVLLDAGIVIDSSVNPHLYSLGTINNYDFRKVPKTLNWKIDPDRGISVAAQEGIFEIPVGTEKMRPFEMLRTPKSERNLPSVVPKGEYVKFENGEKASAKVKKTPSKIIRFIKCFFTYRNFSLDFWTYKTILRDLDHIYKKFNSQKKDQYICLICHPKLADQARIDNISRMIEALNQSPDKYQIVTCRDVYDDLIHGGFYDKGI